jgi:prepilin peptidase CpaA
MDWLFGTALLVLLGLAAWQDLSRRRVPNAIVVAVMVLWTAHALSSGPAGAVEAVGVATAVLAVGFAAWRLGCVGGGDVKLTAALGLWAGAQHVLPMLLVIAVAGGVLAMIFLVLRHPACTIILSRPRLAAAASLALGASPAAPAEAGRPMDSSASATLPFGIAIAAGGCWLVHRLVIG